MEHDRRKPFRARSKAAALALLGVLALSGCVYLRLLEVKRQLNDFDAFYALEGDPELVIVCKSPVMLAKDMAYLIGREPFSAEASGDNVCWHYDFNRVPHPEDGGEYPMDRLSLDFELSKGKVSRLVVPVSFMRLFPRQVLVETLRAAPNAEVLQLRKTVVARNRLSPEADEGLPDREKTLALMGRPLETEERNGLESLVYRYRIVDDERNVPIIARLMFSPDGVFRRVVVRWDTATVDVSFVRPAPDDSP